MTALVGSDDTAGPSAGQKRKRGFERRAERARKAQVKAEWEKKRSNLLFNYTKHNFYGVPVSLFFIIHHPFFVHK